MKIRNSKVNNLICLIPLLGFAHFSHAQDPIPNPFETLNIQSLRGDFENTPTDEGIIEKGEITALFSLNESSNGIDPINENVEIVCVDGKRQIHISLPAGVFEKNNMGGFSIINANDPQGMGIKIFLLDEFGTILESYEKSLIFLHASLILKTSNSSSRFSLEVEIQEEEDSSALASCDRITLALGGEIDSGKYTDGTWVFVFGDDFGSIGDGPSNITKTEFEILAN